MKYLSVCSGIEAATVAWEPLGWEAVGFSEIEAFPCAVLQHHYPHVPLHGDFTQLIENPPACDVLVGGTPCQAFSVAGARRSLDDARGNLTLAYVELANAIDRRNREEGKAPVITVWENVPGVFSTGDNAFGCFLGGLSGEDVPLEPPGGKWTHCGVVLGPQRAVAWRVLDAQYFGLAQRRQRVFVVASARDGFDPSQVLLEWEGVRRDLAPSREARKEAPAPARSRAAKRDGGGAGSVGNFPWPQDVADPLTTNEAKTYTHEGTTFRTRNVVPHVVGPLTARFGGSAMGAPEVDGNLYIPVVETLPERDVVGCLSDGAHMGGGLNGQDAYTGRILAAKIVDPIAFDSYNGTVGAVAPTLCTLGDHATGNAGVLQTFAAPAIGVFQPSSLAGTITAHSGSNAGETATPAYVVEGDFPWPQDVADPLTTNEAKTYTHEGTTFRTRNVVPHLVDGVDRSGDGAPPILSFSCKDYGADVSHDVTPTLRAMVHGDTWANGGGQLAVMFPEDVVEPMAFDTYNQTTSRVTQTLCSRGDTPGGNAHLVPAVLAKIEVVDDAAEPDYCYPDADELGYAPFDEVVDTTPLAASAHVPSVALASVLAPTLTASNDPSRSPQSAEITQQVTAVFAARMVVRRLTPRECERLQGFPDDYTSISWKGKPAVDCPDGPRYKALGNSMAVPCMAWIGRRIVRHLSESAG